MISLLLTSFLRIFQRVSGTKHAATRPMKPPDSGGYMRPFPAICIIVILPLITGCGAVIELEEENARLISRVDSLEMANAECGARLSASSERMSALEQENLRLDDRNRLLAARLAELPGGAIAADGGTTGDAVLPPPRERGGDVDDGAADPRPVRDAAAAPPPVSARTTDGRTPSPRPSPAPATEAAPVRLTPEERAAASWTWLANFAAQSPADERFLSRYQAALNLYHARKFDQSIASFEGLLAENHRNDMIDNCLYWIGEAQSAAGRHREAVRSFSDVISLRESDKVDDALMMRAICHQRLGDTAAARKDYQTLLTLYPNSEFASRAQSRMRALR